MSFTILEDGAGTGKRAKVDVNNRLFTNAITLTEYELGALEGRAFNANTEDIALTENIEHAVFYLKNNEDKPVSIQGFFIAISAVTGTTSGLPIVRAYFNPTGGTLVSDANAITPVNRDAGSAKTFDFDCYKGADGKTITGQDSTPILYQYQSGGGRSFGSVNLVIPKGSSIAITVNLNTVGGGANIYTGFTGFVRGEE